MLETSIRTLASLLFAVVVCASFLAFLTVSKLKSAVLEPSFYTTVLEENDSYETIHAGLLEEIADSEEVAQLREDLGVDSDEYTELANEVIPVSYVKAQIDGIISGVLTYLRGDVDDPLLFIEFAGPLERIRRVSLDFVDRRVDSAELTYPATAPEYAEDMRELAESVGRGNIPRRAPSLANIPKAAIESAFYHASQTFYEIDPRSAASLRAFLPDIEALAVEDPDGREAMKLAARAVVSPFINEAIAKMDSHLDDQDRFDLIEAAAEASDMPRDQFLDDVDEIRDPINTLQGVGPTIALLVMAFATLGLALVNLPHRVSMLMWPGIVLILTGIVAIVVSALLSSALANVTYDICGDAADFACEPVVDILRELTRSVADLPILPSVVLIVIGALGATLAAVVMTRQTFDGQGSGRPNDMSDDRPKEGW